MKGKITSIPLWGHLLFIALSICLIWFGDDGPWSDVGYSLIASTIVALLTDIINTQLNRKQNKAIFIRATAELKALCEEFATEVHTSALEVNGFADESKRTYSEWITLLFNKTASIESKEKCLNEIGYLLEKISSVRHSAHILGETIKIHYENENFDEDYEKKLKHLCSKCEQVQRSFNSGRYDQCLEYFVELEKIIPDIFTDLKSLYTEPYNEEEYS